MEDDNPEMLEVDTDATNLPYVLTAIRLWLNMDRIVELIKMTAENFVKACFYVYFYRSIMLPSLPVLMTEGILGTIQYYIFTYDFGGAFFLMTVNFVLNYMICEFPGALFATVFTMTGFLTFYRAFYDLMTDHFDSKLSFMLLYRSLYCEYPVNYVYVLYSGAFCIYFWCIETTYTRDSRDWPLAFIFLGCGLCMYNNRFEEDDVVKFAVLLNLWMFLKSCRYLTRHTWMVPNPFLVLDRRNERIN